MQGKGHLIRAIGSSTVEANQRLRNDVPAGLVVGCKKVKELVPKVRLARFHRESLPSRRGLVGGGEAEAEAEAPSDGEACDILDVVDA